MAKIKQVAIAVGNPEASAKYYSEALGLEIIGKVTNENEEGYFLTDGDINIALFKFYTEEAAHFVPGGVDYRGLHHLGFLVDDAEEACKKLEDHGSELIPVANRSYSKYFSPNGEIVEVTQIGWPGMSATLSPEEAYVRGVPNVGLDKNPEVMLHADRLEVQKRKAKDNKKS
tara:strand:- start:27 stop:542 length:516 start_codon:yes stop_codon:yes gene_type:complete